MSPAAIDPTPAASASSSVVSPDHAADAVLLHERARRLAQPPTDVAPPGASMQVMEFRLGQESWAIDVRHIREVVPLKDLTPLPSTPAFVRGIVNVRGRILPVFDLKRYFDLPESGLDDLHWIVLIAGHDLEFGLLVDATVAVHLLPRDRLKPAPATWNGVRSDFLIGVTAERLIVLDLDRMLTDPSLLVHDDIEST